MCCVAELSTQCFLYIHLGVAGHCSFRFLSFSKLSQIHHRCIISPPSQQSPALGRVSQVLR